MKDINQAVPPIIGAVALVLGAGLAIALEMRTEGREELDVSLSPPHQNDNRHYGALEENKDSSGRNSASATSESCPQDVNMVPIHESRLRIPTVSESISKPKSPSYVVFAIAAIVHSVCLILTSIHQREEVIALAQEYSASKAATIAVAVAVAGGSSLVLASFIPAIDGSKLSLIMHIVFVLGFFWSSIAWMAASCIIAKQSGLARAVFVFRLVFASLAGASVFWTVLFGFRSTMLEKKGTSAWLRSMNMATVGEIFYGLFYSAFLGTFAA